MAIIATLCNDDYCLKWKYTKWNILLNPDIGLYLMIIYDITQMTKNTLVFSYCRFFQTSYICELLFPGIDDKLIYIITDLIRTLEIYRCVFVTEAGE